MKYNMTKKVCYSIIIAAMAIGFTLIAIFGIDENGSGSAKDINLGLDLAGGVSITYEIQEDLHHRMSMIQFTSCKSV